MILSPYVILTDSRRAKCCRLLRQRDVGDHASITNSLNSTDNLLAQAGYANDRQCSCWTRASSVYHFIGPDTMHAKALLINGGNSAMIGSYNFDPRSAGLNREIGAHFRPDDDPSGEVLGEIDRDGCLLPEPGRGPSARME